MPTGGVCGPLPGGVTCGGVPGIVLGGAVFGVAGFAGGVLGGGAAPLPPTAAGGAGVLVAGAASRLAGAPATPELELEPLNPVGRRERAEDVEAWSAPHASASQTQQTHASTRIRCGPLCMTGSDPLTELDL
ncbi:MAG TPA: hypothetical protein VJR89_03315 [Polyangiales bacterium]|nr:hypothetical protein [Polyangiales bacterium]